MRVQLRPERLNNLGSAHGGSLFNLADSAFGSALRGVESEPSFPQCFRSPT